MAMLAGGLLAAPLAPEAQPAGKEPRVGYVTSATRSVNVDGFERELCELGYTIGRDIAPPRRGPRGVIARTTWTRPRSG